MKYILHDTTAIDDDKLGELFINFGYEGIGLFWTILEKIGKQEKPIKTTVLKAQLKVGKKLDKCWKFMESLGLISSNNGETFNERILSYSESYKIKKEKTREKISQWRENQQITKNVTSYVPICNPPKVKESKVKESKVNKESIEKVEFTPSVDLKNSNLFRQPSIPTEQQVLEGFLNMGGTKEMAEAFFNKNTATSWFLKGSPITNFRNLIPSFIENWKKNDSRNSKIVKLSPSQERELARSTY